MSIPKRFILFCSKNKQNAIGACEGSIPNWLATTISGSNGTFPLTQDKMLKEIFESPGKQSHASVYKGKSDWTTS